MKSRLRKTLDPCQGCFLHKDYCICEFIPRLDLKTRISLVVHYKELKRTSNTGRLAIKALVNSELVIRGFEQTEKTDLTKILNPNYQSLLLYPADGAEFLTQEYLENYERPIHLIVPDGNWRQASKVNSRHLELKDVPRVKLLPRVSGPLFLRKEHIENGMATLEAIAAAFGVIESSEVGAQLSQVYKLKLEQTLKARGTKLNLTN